MFGGDVEGAELGWAIVEMPWDYRTADSVPAAYFCLNRDDGLDVDLAQLESKYGGGYENDEEYNDEEEDEEYEASDDEAHNDEDELNDINEDEDDESWIVP